MKDQGYGMIGNLSKRHLFNILSKEEEKEYRDYLKKQDKLIYQQFVEWEKEMNKIPKEID